MLKHFKNYVIGNILTKILAFITIPIISSLLTPSDYGFYSVFIANVSIITMFVTLNMGAAIGIFWFDKKIKINIMIGTIVISVVTIFLVLFPAAYGINQYVNYREKIFLLLLFAFIVFNFIDSIFQQVFSAKRASKQLAFLTVLRSVLLFLITLFLIYNFRDKYILIYAHFLTGLIFTVISIFYLKQYIPLSFNCEYFKMNIKLCLPHIFYTMSGVILSSVDRIMLKKYIGYKEAGLYSFAFSIAILVSNMISKPLLRSWTPNYFEDMNVADYGKIKTEVFLMYKLIIVASLGMIYFNNIIAYLLVNPRYYDGFVIIPFVTVSYMFFFFWNVYSKSFAIIKNSVYLAVIGVIAGGANIVLNWLLIPEYGLRGAVYGTLVSYVLMTIFAYLLSRYKLKIYVVPFGDFKYINVLFILGLVMYYFFSDFEIVLIDTIIKSIGFSIISILLLHKEIKKVYVRYIKRIVF